MKPWGKGSRKRNVEDLDILKTTVFQIETTGNIFKNFKRMQKYKYILKYIIYLPSKNRYPKIIQNWTTVVVITQSI